MKCAAGGRRRPIPQKFLRDSDEAKIYFFPLKKKKGSATKRCVMAEVLSIDCWHKPQQALAGLKSTSVIRSSHHLEERQIQKRRHDVKIERHFLILQIQ